MGQTAGQKAEEQASQKYCTMEEIEREQPLASFTIEVFHKGTRYEVTHNTFGRVHICGYTNDKNAMDEAKGIIAGLAHVSFGDSFGRLAGTIEKPIEYMSAVDADFCARQENQFTSMDSIWKLKELYETAFGRAEICRFYAIGK